MNNENTMGEAEKAKKLLELKSFLEKKTEETEKELERLRNLLKFVESALIETGFKKAEMAKQTQQEIAVMATKPSIEDLEDTGLIKTVMGENLATIHEGKNFLKVVTTEDKTFDINTPPFMQFLVDRVLVRMQEKDRELARTGEISPEEMLSYNIVRDGNILKELTIRNVTEDRIRELKSSIRWTLEKMHEKTETT